MNAFLEPLPGLLDDPQFQIPDLPHLTDYHIAPLRDPAPSRSLYAPLPLEPTTGNNVHARTAPTSKHVLTKRKTPKISPTEPVHARNAKKPNLAISELLEAHTEREPPPFQLPSFISLAIVERSPVQHTQSIEGFRSHKRPRLDFDDAGMNEEYRRLPLPSQKDEKNAGRTKPLLPAMVTGLHEPPPTAALLPSMETEKLLSRSPKKTIRLNLEPSGPVTGKRGQGRPPEQMLNSPEIATMTLAPCTDHLQRELEAKTPKLTGPKVKNVKSKSRRTPKKWTEEETEQLMQGVRKHGIGKWKQILADPDLHFDGRSSVDLKDRFRVCMPDAYRDRDLVAVDKTIPEITVEHEEHPSSREQDSIGGNVAKDSLQAPPGVTEASQPAHGPALSPSPPQEHTNSPAPGTKARRRKRRPWTTAEDNDLMRGVQRHGFQWTLIHDDTTLNLLHRKATDLRDRIRNMFPDGYKNAGTRPKKEQGEGMRTLPPLVLDEDGDWDWSNNTLPPLLEWEDMGI